MFFNAIIRFIFISICYLGLFFTSSSFFNGLLTVSTAIILFSACCLLPEILVVVLEVLLFSGVCIMVFAQFDGDVTLLLDRVESFTSFEVLEEEGIFFEY